MILQYSVKKKKYTLKKVIHNLILKQAPYYNQRLINVIFFFIRNLWKFWEQFLSKFQV